MTETTNLTPDVSDDDHELLQMILEHISPRVALMNPGEKTKAKGLFDPEYWKSITDQERRHMGKCVVHLAAESRVPLESLGASPRTANHIVYRKI